MRIFGNRPVPLPMTLPTVSTLFSAIFSARGPRTACTQRILLIVLTIRQPGATGSESTLSPTVHPLFLPSEHPSTHAMPLGTTKSRSCHVLRLSPSRPPPSMPEFTSPGTARESPRRCMASDSHRLGPETPFDLARDQILNTSEMGWALWQDSCPAR